MLLGDSMGLEILLIIFLIIIKVTILLGILFVLGFVLWSILIPLLGYIFPKGDSNIQTNVIKREN